MDRKDALFVHAFHDCLNFSVVAGFGLNFLLTLIIYGSSTGEWGLTKVVDIGIGMFSDVG